MTSALKNVYIIDDEPAVRDSLSLMMEQDDFQVVGFDSAEAFLASDPADYSGCAIIDVKMTGMGGMQLHEEMFKRGLHLPIVFLTGHGNIPMSVRAIKAGAVDFLTKPVARDKLLNSVRAAIATGEYKQLKAGHVKQIQALLGGLTQRESDAGGLRNGAGNLRDRFRLAGFEYF